MDGGTFLGTGSPSQGVATFTTTDLSAGTHTITAVFGGDMVLSGSTSAGLLQVVVQG